MHTRNLVGALLAAFSLSSALAGEQNSEIEKVREAMQAFLPALPVGELVASPIPGVFAARVDGKPVYVAGDGRFMFTGDLVDLKTLTNISAKQRGRDNLKVLAELDAEQFITYSAADERARIKVLTDTSCPYCRKLHQQVPDLLAQGVSVSYLPFPRGGKAGPGYADLKSVWCAKDRHLAMDIAKEVVSGELGSDDCAAARYVDIGYEVGNRLGISGTPTIILPDGQLIQGYRPVPALLRRLGIAQP